MTLGNLPLCAYAAIVEGTKGVHPREEGEGSGEGAIAIPARASDNEHLPLSWDLATSQQPIANAGNSWWSSSYIYASDGRQYFIVSHVGDPLLGFYRYSVLDIQNPENYRQYSVTGTESDPIGAHIHGANITLPTYGFEAVNPSDPLQSMRTWSTSGVEFDLTFDLSSPVIINGGSGTFTWGPFLTYEWSLVGGTTKGSFTINNTQLSIVPERSLTWYDRQVVWLPTTTSAPPGTSAAHNWTWFQLHYHDDDDRLTHLNHGSRPSKVSAWIWDYADSPRVQFATTLQESGQASSGPGWQPQQQVIRITEFTPSNRVWTSPGCGGSYHLDWTVKFQDGTELFISALRDDQEFCDTDSGDHFQPTYEGYITFVGADGFGRPVSGYGLVEICLANIG
ncbi:hypothetical protein BDV19DRAFT_400372 [Aspergillus venezuelensis]